VKFIPSLLAAVALTAPAFASDIRVQADRYQPINGAPDEKPAGYGIELMVEVFTDTDDVVYTLQPYADSLAAAKTGRTNAVIGVAKDEAPDLVFPREPIGSYRPAIWVKKASALTQESYIKARIGVVQGYTYWPELDKLIAARASNVVVFSGDNALQDALAALAAGTIDAYPEDLNAFKQAVAEKQLDLAAFDIRYTHAATPLYLAFTPSIWGRELAAKWDERIAALRKSGRFKAILGAYGVADWAAETK
jgi:polar amino acid transport system substrate-binding protein